VEYWLTVQDFGFLTEKDTVGVSFISDSFSVLNKAF